MYFTSTTVKSGDKKAALFFLIIDHWGFKSQAFCFRVIGMNSIFVYLFDRIVDIDRITEFFFGWLIKYGPENNNIVLLTGNLVIIWLILYFMYKKKIFIRI
jgi:predicted acyltransferase